MSSSNPSFSNVFSVPMSVFQYPPSAPASITSLPRIKTGDRYGSEAPVGPSVETAEEELRLGITLTEEALAARLAMARAEGREEAEAQLRREYEARVAVEAERVSSVIREFEASRTAYFSRVELEVVHLALSIAGKILHREAQVDPMLVAALVQIALGQLKDGSSVAIRVRPEEAARWSQHFDRAVPGLKVTVIPDAELGAGGCVLETELGSANFSLDAQLKEVEQGFFDVLAQRP